MAISFNHTGIKQLNMLDGEAVEELESFGGAENIYSFDVVALAACMLLSAIGILMVYSTTGISASGGGMGFFFRHVASIGIGIIGAIIAYRIPPQVLRYFALPLLILSIASLLAVLILGSNAGGATRWINLGFIRLQPGEFVKLAMVVCTASYISLFYRRLSNFVYGILIPGAILCLFGVLFLLQPDFGSTAVLFLVTGAQLFMFVGLSHFFAVGACAVVAATALVWVSPYRMRRFTAFLDPFSDPSSSGYQLIQSLIAVGSGGLLGQGLGVGKQKLFYLPAAHTDFIFAVIAEEFGMVGSLCVLGLFVLLATRGISIVLAFSRSAYFSSLAFGFTILLTLPAILNIGVVLGVLPTKGLVLPFVSYGGTAMVSSWIALGFLLRLSAEANSQANSQIENG